MYKFLWECKFSLLWDKCPGVQFLSHLVVFLETSKLFSGVALLLLKTGEHADVLKGNQCLNQCFASSYTTR